MGHRGDILPPFCQRMCYSNVYAKAVRDKIINARERSRDGERKLVTRECTQLRISAIYIT